MGEGKLTRKEHILDAVSRAGVVRIRSIANNPLWLCAVIVPVCFVAALAALGFGDRAFAWVAVGIAIFVIIFAVAFISYFALADPDRLQSEEYQLRQQYLQYKYRQDHRPEKYDTNAQPAEYLDSQARIENGEKR